MKITLIGYWKNIYYEQSLKEGLENNNIKVDKISVLKNTKFTYYYNNDYLKYLFKKIEILDNKILFFWQCNEISKKFFIKLKKKNFKIIQYHNDNPFNYSNILRFLKFYKYRSRINYSDLVLYYRKGDTKYLKKYNTAYYLLPPFYNSSMHYDSQQLIKNDVIFIGHHEKDNRDEYINYLYKNNINIKIRGPKKLWINSKINSSLKHEIKAIYNNEYRNTLNESKIGICFLSSINRDEYTRRCFELPACGTPILMPKTKQLTKIFGNYQQFFNTKEELLELVNYYIKNPNKNRELLIRQQEAINDYEVNEVTKKLSKKIIDLDKKNNIRILFHHPSLTTYRLYFFQRINAIYPNIKFIFNYNNLKKLNNIKNSIFLSNKEWNGTSGKLIFKKNLFFRPNYDLLITSDHVNLPEIILFFIYLLFNKKIFIWSAINRRIYKKKNLLKKIYLNFIYKKCDLILCINSQNKEFFNKRLDYNKSIILPNTTVNFSKFFNKEKLNYNKEKINLKNSSKNILYVGRIEESKGITSLLKALSAIQYPKFNLILVGKNNLNHKTIKKYASLPIIFHDEVTTEKLRDFYSLADIFVFPSLEDTWGMVINEVFSYDCVVICSKNAGCYPDLANEENSLCFDPKNLNDLTTSIKNGLENKEKYIYRDKKDKKLNEFSLNKQLEIFNGAISKFF